MGWLDGWQYRVPITVDNSSNSNSLADYQVLVTIDTASLIANGKMNADGGDIRFTADDGTTILSHWIEDGTINTTYTRIWVKVPSILANSTTTIYIYYGNPSATSISSIDNTMLFGDDFNDGVFDTNKWIFDTLGTNGQITESDGILTLYVPTSSDKCRLNSTYSFNYAEGFRFYCSFVVNPEVNALTYEVGVADDLTNTDGLGDRAIIRKYTGTYEVIQDGTVYGTSYLSLPSTDFRIFSIFSTGTSETKFEQRNLDGSLYDSGSLAVVPTDSLGVRSFVGYTGATYIKFDFISITKYTAIEPSIILGTEETYSITASFSETLSLSETFTDICIYSMMLSESLSFQDFVKSSVEISYVYIENISMKDSVNVGYTIPYGEAISFTDIVSPVYVLNVSDSIQIQDLPIQDLDDIYDLYTLTTSDFWIYTVYYENAPTISYEGDGVVMFSSIWDKDDTTTYSYDIQNIDLTVPVKDSTYERTGIHIPIYKLKKTNKETVISTIRLVIE